MDINEYEKDLKSRLAAAKISFTYCSGKRYGTAKSPVYHIAVSFDGSWAKCGSDGYGREPTRLPPKGLRMCQKCSLGIKDNKARELIREAQRYVATCDVPPEYRDHVELPETITGRTDAISKYEISLCNTDRITAYNRLDLAMAYIAGIHDAGGTVGAFNEVQTVRQVRRLNTHNGEKMDS